MLKSKVGEKVREQDICCVPHTPLWVIEPALYSTHSHMGRNVAFRF